MEEPMEKPSKPDPNVRSTVFHMFRLNKVCDSPGCNIRPHDVVILTETYKDGKQPACRVQFLCKKHTRKLQANIDKAKAAELQNASN